MSRGLGTVQREVLELAQEERNDARPDLWCRLRGDRLGRSWSRARAVSIHRAVTNLAAQGLIEKGYYRSVSRTWRPTGNGNYADAGDDFDYMFAGRKWFVAIRWPLTVSEAEDAEALSHEYEENLAKLWVAVARPIVESGELATWETLGRPPLWRKIFPEARWLTWHTRASMYGIDPYEVTQQHFSELSPKTEDVLNGSSANERIQLKIIWLLFQEDDSDSEMGNWLRHIVFVMSDIDFIYIDRHRQPGGEEPWDFDDEIFGFLTSLRSVAKFYSIIKAWYSA